MAKVTIKETPPVKVIKTYILELSEEEAATVYALAGAVTGNDTLSPRGHANSVFYAFKGAGLNYWVTPEVSLKDGTLSFDNYPEKHRDRRPKH